MLTGKELYESGMITGALESSVQPQSVGLHVGDISKIDGMGVFPETGEPVVPELKEIKLLRFHNKKIDQHIDGWMLPAGVYEIEFTEGININDTSFCYVSATEALTKSGAILVCPPIFNNRDKIRATLWVSNTMLINKNAVVAQIFCFNK